MFKIHFWKPTIKKTHKNTHSTSNLKEMKMSTLRQREVFEYNGNVNCVKKK